MHPNDHKSMPFVYRLAASKISGARYHLVATYSVNSGWASMSAFSAVSVHSDLAKPKSANLTVQSASRRTLDGFKSRWITLPEWRYFTARYNWYMIYCLWISCKSLLERSQRLFKFQNRGLPSEYCLVWLHCEDRCPWIRTPNKYLCHY